MNWNASFQRKVAYIVGIVVLVFPLAWIGMPATNSSPGGQLATMRSELKLSQANLGEIDPASETMKLASLGMHGTAVAMLWDAANEFKKKNDWDNYKAVLNQIIKLEPNFVTVWEHQSWNLSYNVSVEFDDYRQRYHWVKKGIDFLIEGTKYNREDPRLLSYIGWIFGHKIGRSDEHIQFRRLFRLDRDFHATIADYGIPISLTMGPDIQGNSAPDNWLVAHEWHLRSQRSVAEGRSLRGKGQLLFYSEAPMDVINFAQALEEEGIFGEKSRLAWQRGGDLWTEYGSRTIPTSWGVNIRLNDLDTGGSDRKGMKGEIARLQAQLDALVPGLRDRLREEKKSTLTAEEAEALSLPDEQRTPDHFAHAAMAESKLQVTHEEVANRASPENIATARSLAIRLADTEQVAYYIERYRSIVNFDYWRDRCSAEQQPYAVLARQLVHDADKLVAETVDFEGAKVKYEQGWIEWAKVHENYPALLEDVTADDLLESIGRYREVLDQLRLPFPKDFPLVKFLDVRKQTFHRTSEAPTPGETPAPPADDKKPPMPSGEGDKPPEAAPAAKPDAPSSPPPASGEAPKSAQPDAPQRPDTSPPEEKQDGAKP